MPDCRNKLTERMVLQRMAEHSPETLLCGLLRGARSVLSQVRGTRSDRDDPLLCLDARLLSDIGIHEDWIRRDPPRPHLAALSNRAGGVPFGCQAGQ